MRRLLIFITFFGCQNDHLEDSPSKIVFETIATNIEPNLCGEDNQTQILEVNGTGLGLFDFDNDEDLDLFVVNGAYLEDYAAGPGCRLYENTSESGLISFIDVTEKSGINIDTFAIGVAIGDVNGDSFDDLYVTCHGPNQLLINNGNGTFIEMGQSAGIDDNRWGTSASFGDLDGDGDLDLYVCNYLEFDPINAPPRANYKGMSVLGGPHGLTPQDDVVFQNNGDGTFVDVTELWGFLTEPAYALNVAILDFNNDGLQDVFVGNDSMANNLFLNQGNRLFAEAGVRTGAASNGDGAMQATMGIAISDVNGDLRPDIFTTNFSSDTNTLLINNEDCFFEDQTKQFGLGLISRTMLGWSCGFHDFDGDSKEDLFIVNGHVYPEASYEMIDSQRLQPMLVLQRQGNRFVSIQQQGIFDDRAAVFGDLDSDGDIDVIISQRTGGVRVLQNNSTNEQYIKVILKGSQFNTKGLGTALQLKMSDESIQSKWNHDESGFQSSSSTPIIFSYRKGIFPKELKLVWPNGVSQTVPVSSQEIIVKQPQH